jgi:SepF-like predicted cell division protein (DUF552 family)
MQQRVCVAIGAARYHEREQGNVIIANIGNIRGRSLKNRKASRSFLMTTSKFGGALFTSVKQL